MWWLFLLVSEPQHITLYFGQSSLPQDEGRQYTLYTRRKPPRSCYLKHWEGRKGLRQIHWIILYTYIFLLFFILLLPLLLLILLSFCTYQLFFLSPSCNILFAPCRRYCVYTKTHTRPYTPKHILWYPHWRI